MVKIIEDLILTDSFLIKGRIESKYSRLSKVLDEFRKQFLTMLDATLIDLRTRERIETPKLLINVSEIIFAHELIDSQGDVYLKDLATDRCTANVRAFFSGKINLEMAGEIQPGWYETTSTSQRFFVMTQPTVRGVNWKGDPDLEIVEKMEYIIVHRNRLSYLYDFSSQAAGFSEPEKDQNHLPEK